MSALEAAERRTCMICCKETACYVCPRCNIPYCSLACYRSEKHTSCSEAFYHDCVVEELSSRSGQEKVEARQRMEEILTKHHLGVTESPSASLDSDDSDEESEAAELCERLLGVDLDDADAVWERLSAAERSDFEKLVHSGDISVMLPAFKPWWENENKCLVQEMEPPEEDGMSRLGSSAETNVSSKKIPVFPPICSSIPSFSSICKKPVSPCVPFNVANVVAAYTYTARSFNGEHLDWPTHAAYVAWNLTAVLSHNHNFHTLTDAIMAVTVKASEDESANGDIIALVHSDVRSILSSSTFVKASLSDLLALFQGALHQPSFDKKGQFSKRFPNGEESQLTRVKLKLALKKVEFYLSWMLQHNYVFTLL